MKQNLYKNNSVPLMLWIIFLKVNFHSCHKINNSIVMELSVYMYKTVTWFTFTCTAVTSLDSLCTGCMHVRIVDHCTGGCTKLTEVCKPINCML